MTTERRKSRIVASSKAIVANFDSLGNTQSLKNRVNPFPRTNSKSSAKLKILVTFMLHSILNPVDLVENENGSEDEFQSGFGACNLDKVFNRVKVSFPIIVKNLIRFCHKREQTVNIVVDTP